MKPDRLTQLTKLLALDPADAFVLYGLAHEHAKVGEHERAVEYFDRCLAADPAYCYAYYHKAVSLKALDRDNDAKRTLEAGVAAAQTARDGKALGEISAMLDSM